MHPIPVDVRVQLAGFDEFLKILREFARQFQVDQSDMNLSVVSVTGRTNMAPVIKHLPDLNMVATEKETLSVAPVNPDGSAYTGPPPTWTTSDATQVPIVPAADGLSCECQTPLDNGQATITVSAPGVRTSDIKIIYTAPVEGEMNLSAGLPQPD